MDLIRDYSSESDSGEEESEEKKSREIITEAQSPPAPPPLQIFSQQYQNMHSGSKVSVLFTSIPWNPSITTLARLEKAVNYSISQLPSLSNNYRFVVPNKDPFRLEKHHITICPALHMKEAVELQFIDCVREKLVKSKPSSTLLSNSRGKSSPLSKIIHSKTSICLRLEDTITIGKSPLKDSLFCMLKIKQTPETLQYLSSLQESCTTAADRVGAQLQFPELLKDPLHVSIATGYVTRKSLSDQEVKEINHSLSSINVGQFTKDIDVAVDEMTIRNIMSKSHQKAIERQLLDIVNSRGNDNRCGECGAEYPTWASYNLGMFLCGRCASAHRRILGPPNYNISKVKSLTLDRWSDQQVDKLRRVGNARAKKRWNPKRIPFPFDGDDDVTAVEQYIRDKYILGKFRDDDVDPSEFDDDRMSKYSSNDDSHSRHSARSRSNSTRSIQQLPKLTHRKLTTYEYSQYQLQQNQMRSFGYQDRDAALESLLLANGDVELAIDIYKQDAKVNPGKEEIAPGLPTRPRPTTAQAQSTTSSGPVSSNSDWWSNPGSNVGSATVSTMPTGAQPVTPQIYQYTDPVTGLVSYVDSNGQEYLDPNNPQHQQQLMNMTNPQLVAQQTNKQNIMSLYNQPTTASPQSQGGQQQQSYFPQQNGLAQAAQTGLNQPGFGYIQQPQPQSQQQTQPQATGFGQVPQPQFTGFGQQQPQVTGLAQPPQTQFTGYGQPQQSGFYNQQGFR
ncbi:GTS1 [Candida theae]|uniref:GTS1 n=1 Tax=Candida theae TaxID=1198502 RepID=A0AAD5BFB9_9ASCO|nr:GTS1 [Candida theae]KAI5958859.1 GTS1 [Candida theae]